MFFFWGGVTKVWVRTNLHIFSGLLSAFKPISALLWSVWFQLHIRSPIYPVSFSKPFGDHSKSFNSSWYYHHFHVPQLFQFSSKIYIFVYLFLFLSFDSVGSAETAKSTWCRVIFSLLVFCYIMNRVPIHLVR